MHQVRPAAARSPIAAGDSLLFRARAFDGEGRTIVFANVGNMRSNVLDITVTQ